MDKLADIPVQQQIVLVILFLLLVMGGIYFLFVSPLESEISNAQSKYGRLGQEYEKLKQYRQAGKLEELKAAEEEERIKIERNRTMLPTEAELPKFIESIKADADAVGLVIQRFEMADAVPEDYYRKIPINVRALGTFTELIDFLKALAAPSKRTVNVADIQIERLHAEASEIEDLMGRASSQMAQMANQRGRKAASAEHRRYAKIMEHRARSEQSFIDAEFTIYAFSYTGTPLTGAQRIEKAKHSRRRRR